MDRIGRYVIVGELGRGAMGIALKATDSAIGRTVAIKIINLSELADPSDRERLKGRLFHEARSAGALSHPGIVTIYDVGEENNLAYIAMELISGRSLDQTMSADDPLEPEAALRILRETASALDFAHKRGIVHRDVKPANIMIDEEGRVRVTDFGIAKIPASQIATQAGVVLGTPGYMSPEQALGKPVDGRSDQFSLAVIAYEMLTGEKPFVADELPSLVYRIAHVEQEPAQNLNPTLGWPVSVVLRRALDKGPAARYPSCEEFVSALESACKSCPGWKPIPRGRERSLPTLGGDSPVSVTALPKSASAPTEPQPGSRSKLLMVTALSAVVTLALISIFLILFSGRRSPVVAPSVPEEEASAEQGRPSPTGPALVSEKPPDEAPSSGSDAAFLVTKPEPVLEKGSVPPSAAPAGVATTVLLRTSPPGAAFVVDSNSASRCTSPCSVDLTPGRHTATASLEGYRPGLRIFRVPDETDLFLYLARMSGQVQILSTPPGAAILIDGQSQPQTTPATLNVPAGKRAIAVVKEGYARQEQELEVKDTAFVKMEFTLQ
jgi:serine/threonine-protein kinase